VTSKGKIQERKGGKGEILRKGRAGAPTSRGDFPIGQVVACSDADGSTCITAPRAAMMATKFKSGGNKIHA